MFNISNKKPSFSFVSCIALSYFLASSVSISSDESAKIETETSETPYILHNKPHESKLFSQYFDEVYDAQVIIRRDFFYKNLKEFCQKHPELLNSPLLHPNELDAEKYLSYYQEKREQEEKEREELLKSYLLTTEELKEKLENLKNCVYANMTSSDARRPEPYSRSRTSIPSIDICIDTRTDLDFSFQESESDSVPSCPVNHKSLWSVSPSTKGPNIVNKNYWPCNDCEISFKAVSWGPLKFRELDLLVQALCDLPFVKQVSFIVSSKAQQIEVLPKNGCCKKKHPVKEPYFSYKPHSLKGGASSPDSETVVCVHLKIDHMALDREIIELFLEKGKNASTLNDDTAWGGFWLLPSYIRLRKDILGDYRPMPPSTTRKTFLDDFTGVVTEWRKKGEEAKPRTGLLLYETTKAAPTTEPITPQSAVHFEPSSNNAAVVNPPSSSLPPSLQQADSETTTEFEVAPDLQPPSSERKTKRNRKKKKMTD